MADDPAPFTMIVERGDRRVRRRDQVDRSRYVDGPAPVSPPTFLMTAAFWQAPENSPFTTNELTADISRMLHGEQEFVFHGPPPHAGDALRVTTRIVRSYEKVGRRGGAITFVESSAKYRAPDGRLVTEAKGLGIVTNQTLSRDPT